MNETSFNIVFKELNHYKKDVQLQNENKEMNFKIQNGMTFNQDDMLENNLIAFKIGG